MKIYLLLPILITLFGFSPKMNLHLTPQIYTSLQPSFSFQYPGNGILVTEGLDYPKITFPILESETDLEEKYMTIVVREGNNSCPDANNSQTPPENLMINGKVFQKWEDVHTSAGKIYHTVQYVTHKDGYCICLRFDFVLSGNASTPKRESNVIAEVMATVLM
jgi:hypothetical protein